MLNVHVLIFLLNNINKTQPTKRSIISQPYIIPLPLHYKILYSIEKLIIILIWLILYTKNNVALSLTIISLNLLSNLQKNRTTNNKKLNFF
jgi:hypothetical protein